MKRNDYYDDVLLNMGELGKRSYGIDQIRYPREKEMKSQLQQLTGLQKRKAWKSLGRLSKKKSKQQRLAEKYYASIF